MSPISAACCEPGRRGFVGGSMLAAAAQWRRQRHPSYDLTSVSTRQWTRPLRTPSHSPRPARLAIEPKCPPTGCGVRRRWLSADNPDDRHRRSPRPVHTPAASWQRTALKTPASFFTAADRQRGGHCAVQPVKYWYHSEYSRYTGRRRP